MNRLSAIIGLISAAIIAAQGDINLPKSPPRRRPASNLPGPVPQTVSVTLGPRSAWKKVKAPGTLTQERITRIAGPQTVCF